jgi:integrase
MLAPMPRKATGHVIERGGRRFARVAVNGKRRAFALPETLSGEQAHERCGVVATLAGRLTTAGVEDATARSILRKVAKREGVAHDAALAAAEQIIVHKGRSVAPKPSDGPTFQDIGQRWTSGELAREYPDHVKAKRTAAEDVYRLVKHVYPVVGRVSVADFTLDHALDVMRKLAPSLSASSRRHVGQLLHKILAMCVFPLRLRDHQPLPEGFLPKPGPKKAQGFVYPDEDRILLACVAIPLAWRVLYGWLHREGMRRSEAARLLWRHLDLERNTVRLDANKTDDARAWALAPGVAAALRAWREHLVDTFGRLAVAPDARVFVTPRGKPIGGDNHLAEQYRSQPRSKICARSRSRAAQPEKLSGQHLGRLLSHPCRWTLLSRTQGCAAGKQTLVGLFVGCSDFRSDWDCSAEHVRTHQERARNHKWVRPRGQQHRVPSPRPNRRT